MRFSQGHMNVALLLGVLGGIGLGLEFGTWLPEALGVDKLAAAHFGFASAFVAAFVYTLFLRWKAPRD